MYKYRRAEQDPSDDNIEESLVVVSSGGSFPQYQVEIHVDKQLHVHDDECGHRDIVVSFITGNLLDGLDQGRIPTIKQW